MGMSITVEERDAIYEVVEVQKGTLRDVGTPFAKQQWKKAEMAFRQHLQDCRFLECLRLEMPDENGQVNVGMRDHELRETLSRVIARRTAQLVIEESAGSLTPQQQAFQDRARIALRACERCLMMLDSRYEVWFVVVNHETGGAAAQSTSIQDVALDLCESLNEASAPIGYGRDGRSR